MKFIKHSKGQLIRNLKNIPGWRTNRKVVVIECDDWGGVRMPSQEVYRKLVNAGVNLGQDRFTKYDTLAGVEDLELLFETLKSVSDCRGNPAVMTAVSSVANPDFDKIKASGFRKYHYEPFTETLKNYGGGDEVFKKWKEGMEAGLFVPESHGREHISVQIWLEQLRAGDKDVLQAFEHGFVAVGTRGTPLPAMKFRPEFYFTNEDQIPFLKDSVVDGVNLFKLIFGYTPRVFAPSNSIFHQDLEENLAKSGVKFLHVAHRSPYPGQNGNIRYRRFITGKRGVSGLTYYIRNCAFEPTDEDYFGIDLTLKQINAAFRWKKPAIISTHRVNFVGGNSPQNRDKGNLELKRLLQEIVKRYPDVEFRSAADSLEIMSS